MKFTFILISTAALLTTALPVHGTEQQGDSPIQVEFEHPEKYTDADYGPRSHKSDAEAIFRQLRRHLQKQAPQYLSAGQQLQLTFTDIDLAGDREPSANIELHDVRIVRSVYPPKLAFRYQLLGNDGAVLRQDEVSIRDIGFDLARGLRSSDPLRFEKRMLSQWLSREFSAR